MSENLASSSQRIERSPLLKSALVLAGLASFYVAWVSVYPIFRFTLFPPVGSTTHTCQSGTRALHAAVRKAATQGSSRSESVEAQLKRFRSSLATEWGQLAAINARCRQANQRPALKALNSIVQLRYAEEQALRSQGPQLSRRQKRTLALVEKLNGTE